MDVTETSSNKKKPKLTALPLLVVLFAISYGMLTKLVIEQDKTIDSQRNLIHLLFADNISLSKLHKHAAALPKHSSSANDIAIEFGNPAGARPQAKTPSTQVPHESVHPEQGPSDQLQANRVQTDQVESSQVKTDQAKRPGSQDSAKRDRKARKALKPLPPPVELTDPSDQRRVNFSI